MFRRVFSATLLLCSVSWVFSAAPARAQVLVRKLPPAAEATWVRYEGPFKDKHARPEASEGDLELELRHELTIKALEAETVDVDGTPTPCRWLEFKSIIGRESEQGIQPGPFGTKIYKVLVPEAKVLGQIFDKDGIPVAFLPIVKGYRKVADRDPAPIGEKMVAIYPMLTTLAYSPDLKPAGAAEEMQLPLGAVSARLHKGTSKLESSTSRAEQEGQLWLSNDVPFGVAKFQVKQTLSAKDSAAPKEEFKQTSESQVEMTVVAKGTDAVSDLPDLK